MSHPTWVRGLKHYLCQNKARPQEVAPYVGAWIETLQHRIDILSGVVAPYVGAWIETGIPSILYSINLVAPYVGAWIETRMSLPLDTSTSRTLRGCVD